MTDLDVVPDLTPAPTTLFASDDPGVIVARATRIAETIAPVIRQQNLVKRIGGSEHVFLEVWTLAGSMLGVFATTVRTWEIGDDQGYGATVEARTINGALVGRADAVVMRDEEVGGKRKWLEAPAFQLISMAQTRGSSKALRMPLGFVMKLAGYETTPAEEMEAAASRGETVSGGRGVKPGWKDIQEQQRAHAKMGERIDEHGLRQWVVEWCDSKGYVRPMSKPQFYELQRAIERELAERGQMSGVGSNADGPGVAPSSDSPTPDPTARGGARTTDILAGASGAATPGPTSPPTPPAEAKAGPGGVEGANHSKPGIGEAAPNASDATAPPESVHETGVGQAAASSPGRRPSGGSKPAREDATTGKRPSSRAPSKEEQALFEAAQAADERRRGFTR